MADAPERNLKDLIQNFYPEPVRSAAGDYLASVGVFPDDQTEAARSAYEILSEVARQTDKYDSLATEPALRAVAAAWSALRDELRVRVLATLEGAERPLNVGAFMAWGKGSDSARNVHTIFTLLAMSRVGELWLVDLEDDDGLFGLPTHHQPESVDEAWERICSSEPWPVVPAPLPDDAVQEALFEVAE